MRYLLIFFCFICTSAFSQNVTGYRVQANGNLLPPLDTVLAPYRVGEIRTTASSGTGKLFIAVSLSADKKWYEYPTGGSSANPGGTTGAIQYRGSTGGFSGNVNQLYFDSTNGRLGLLTSSPTARFHLVAGTATASTAPLKLTAGTNLAIPEAGAIEFDGTNYFVTSSTTRYTLAKTLTNTATLDFPDTGIGVSSDLTINVTGAADGDAVVLGVPNVAVPAFGTYMAWVSSSGVVTIRYTNTDVIDSHDPGSGTFRVSVIKY